MSIPKNLLAGLGGAIALNIIHETLKNKGLDMPRVDLVGEEAVQKAANVAGTEIEDEKQLYYTTLVADIISNAIYYSAIGSGGTKNVWTKALGMGLAAGVGAVELPKPLGLNPEPVNKTTKTKVLTTTYYLAGALVTAAILKAISKDTE